MLRSISEIINYFIEAEDGDVGRCKDFLFDDEFWAIRYMVLDTGRWLPGRKVLISPISLGKAEWLKRRFSVKLNREQIENSPPIEEHEPVSRQYERKYFSYFDWPYYWSGGDIWGMTPYPPPIAVAQPERGEDMEKDPEKSHLRSIKEVKGYHIHAEDGEIGHVDDYIVDDETWSIRYMVVDTRNWLPGKKVLVSPQWIKSIEWAENMVSVHLSIKEIKESPEYDPTEPVNREYEALLYDFYGRPVYWE